MILNLMLNIIVRMTHFKAHHDTQILHDRLIILIYKIEYRQKESCLRACHIQFYTHVKQKSLVYHIVY